MSDQLNGLKLLAWIGEAINKLVIVTRILKGDKI